MGRFVLRNCGDILAYGPGVFPFSASPTGVESWALPTFTEVSGGHHPSRPSLKSVAYTRSLPAFATKKHCPGEVFLLLLSVWHSRH